MLDALRLVVAKAPNTILPTEQQLARRSGVSRLTLRRALGLLERSGLVSRQRGRGTVVSPPEVTRLLAPLYTTAYAEDRSLVSRSERCDRIDRVTFTFATRYAPDAAPVEVRAPTGAAAGGRARGSGWRPMDDTKGTQGRSGRR